MCLRWRSPNEVSPIEAERGRIRESGHAKIMVLPRMVRTTFTQIRFCPEWLGPSTRKYLFCPEWLEQYLRKYVLPRVVRTIFT
jgi:hypothetical protein